MGEVRERFGSKKIRNIQKSKEHKLCRGLAEVRKRKKWTIVKGMKWNNGKRGNKGRTGKWQNLKKMAKEVSKIMYVVSSLGEKLVKTNLFTITHSIIVQMKIKIVILKNYTQRLHSRLE